MTIKCEKRGVIKDVQATSIVQHVPDVVTTLVATVVLDGPFFASHAAWRVCASDLFEVHGKNAADHIITASNHADHGRCSERESEKRKLAPKEACRVKATRGLRCCTQTSWGSNSDISMSIPSSDYTHVLLRCTHDPFLPPI